MIKDPGSEQAQKMKRRISKSLDLLGCPISPLGLRVAKRSFDRMTVKRHRLFEQGATKVRLVRCLKNGIRWARTGVSLSVKALNLKTTEILRTRFSVQRPVLAH